MWITAMAEAFGRNKARIGQALSFASLAVLHTVAFPPVNVPEAAFVFLIPTLLWLRSGPSYKTVALTSFFAFWLSWLVLIFWLRHITWAGMILLSAFMALHFTVFVLGTAWLTRRCAKGSPWRGIALALGAAAWWVVIEHTRSWILTGFPWLTLSTSQWDRPIMLQSAAFFGAWSVSFILVLLNAGIAAYLVRIYVFAQTRKRSFCPEFYLSLLVFVSLTFLMTKQTSNQQREPLMKAAVLQPNVPQNEKWDPAFDDEILDRLGRNSTLLGPMAPDALFWPEATLPYPVKGSAIMRNWAENLADDVGSPLVIGAFAREFNDAGEEGWYNSVFMVRPGSGLHPTYYSKRHLVPFGEYIPLRRLWPWIVKVVPIDEDIFPGENPDLIPLSLPDRTLKLGSLICYEDVFPWLARSSVREGAGMLFVATNSAWFGRGGAAAQHMAHSVLRAVETRRIVLRVGNDAWTGWIDEYGHIRESFEPWITGGTTWPLDRDRRWIGQETPYVRNGDWFVLACTALAVLIGLWAWWIERRMLELVV